MPNSKDENESFERVAVEEERSPSQARCGWEEAFATLAQKSYDSEFNEFDVSPSDWDHEEWEW